MTADIPSMVIGTLRANAALGSTSGGTVPSAARQAYEDQCSAFHWHTGTMVSLMRVSGVKTVGMGSPRFFELRRYIALSLSFRQARPLMDATLTGSLRNLASLGIAIPRAPFDQALALTWAYHLFHPYADRAWYEPAVREDQDEANVMHWRLFTDHEWRPIRAPAEYADGLRQRGWMTWDAVKSASTLDPGDAA